MSTQFFALQILKQCLTLGPITMDAVQMTLSTLTFEPVAVSFIRRHINCTNDEILVEPLYEPSHEGQRVLFSWVHLCPPYYQTDSKLS